MNKVLVILTISNNEKTLSDSIQSVLNQTHEDFVLYIIDDASTDDSYKVAARFNDSRIILDRNPESKGRYYCQNIALRAHINEVSHWVAMTGRDTWHPTKIEAQLFKKRNATSCMYNVLNDDSSTIRTVRFSHTSILYSKLVFELIGYYADTKFGGDIEYFARYCVAFNDNMYSCMVPKILQESFLDHTPIDQTEFLTFQQSYQQDVKDGHLRRTFYTDVDSRVLVIMAAYNSSKFIKRSIQSVLNQSHSNLILCVIDDCSTDNTFEVASSIDDSRVIVYRLKSNHGSYFARNIGLLKHVQEADFWTLHDADDVMKPDRIKTQLEFMSNRSGITCMFDRVDINTNKVLVKNRYGHNAFLFKKEVFDTIGFYDSNTRFGGDTEYMERYFKKFGLNRETVLLKKNLFAAYIHGNNQTQIVSTNDIRRKEYVKQFRAEHENCLHKNFKINEKRIISRWSDKRPR